MFDNKTKIFIQIRYQKKKKKEETSNVWPNRDKVHLLKVQKKIIVPRLFYELHVR